MVTTGTYYDGISSIPQKVALILDEDNYLLSFNSSSGNTDQWGIGDISFNHIGNYLEIQFGHAPIEFIKIEDGDFITALKKLRKEKGHYNWYERLIDLGIKAHATIALLILGFISLIYLFVIPLVAENAVVLIPESYDNNLGNTFFNEYIEYNAVDSSKTKALNLFAKQLKLNNSKELKFTVIKSSTVNAFALPDGNIVIFTGLIDLMEDKNELVGLIGHEVTHVNQRHSMKMMCRNLSGYLFLSAVLSDVNGIMAIIGDNVHTLQSLTYSRQFERQADMEGIEIMVSNKVNPKGMSKLFERLQTQDDHLLPEFLSSHPITEERINYIKQIVKENANKELENDKLKDLFLQIKTNIN
ncbi:MAG: M48 family metallopeptidase [Bacteroidota bacterium]